MVSHRRAQVSQADYHSKERLGTWLRQGVHFCKPKVKSHWRIRKLIHLQKSPHRQLNQACIHSPTRVASFKPKTSWITSRLHCNSWLTMWINSPWSKKKLVTRPSTFSKIVRKSKIALKLPKKSFLWALVLSSWMETSLLSNKQRRWKI